MIKIFYKIWVDAIIYEQTNFKGRRNWKFYTIIAMTAAQMFYLYTFIFWFDYFFGINLDFSPDIDLFPGKMLDNGLSATITYTLPIVIINYFVIFYKQKYKKFIKNYGYKNGKLFLSFLILSYGIFVLSILVGIYLGWL